VAFEYFCSVNIGSVGVFIDSRRHPLEYYITLELSWNYYYYISKSRHCPFCFVV